MHAQAVAGPTAALGTGLTVGPGLVASAAIARGHGWQPLPRLWCLGRLPQRPRQHPLPVLLRPVRWLQLRLLSHPRPLRPWLAPPWLPQLWHLWLMPQLWLATVRVLVRVRVRVLVRVLLALHPLPTAPQAQPQFQARSQAQTLFTQRWL